jgi:2-oxoisovalerate dehydrogenase E1 component
MPSTPADAYGLLRSAIRDPNPVVVIEHRLLYGMKGPTVARGHSVPIGQAVIRRPGDDVTVVSVSRMVHESLAAAEELAGEGISVEVIDLRSVSPLDIDTVTESVGRTGRLVVAHEAVRDFGIGAEIAAQVGETSFWHLDAPLARVGALFTPAPYAPVLEHQWLPGRVEIAATIRRLAAV